MGSKLYYKCTDARSGRLTSNKETIMPRFVRTSVAPVRHRRRRVRSNTKFGHYRPSLSYGHRGWTVPKRSKLLRRGIRLNRKNPRFGARRGFMKYTRTGWTPIRRHRRRRSYARRANPFTTLNPIRRRRRRHARRNPVARRHYRRHYRHNPKFSLKAFTNKKLIMTGVSIGGGLVAGFALMPFVNMFMPKNADKTDTIIPRKYLGIVHVAIGALMYGFLKNKMLKDMGLVIAGTGIYDLAVSNIDYLRTDLGLLALPGSSNLATSAKGTGAVSASYPVYSAPVSRVAASYQRGGALQAFGASYSSAHSTQGLNSDMPDMPSYQ